MEMPFLERLVPRDDHHRTHVYLQLNKCLLLSFFLI